MFQVAIILTKPQTARLLSPRTKGWPMVAGHEAYRVTQPAAREVTVETASSGTSVVRARGALVEVDRLACEAVLHLLAVGDGPVVCDLTRGHGAISPESTALLATPARHTRDWPGSPIAFACPPGHLSFHLARAGGPHVVVTHRVADAMTLLQNQPTVTAIHRRLPAIPRSAPVVARKMVARACDEWDRPTQLGPPGVIVSEPGSDHSALRAPSVRSRSTSGRSPAGRATPGSSPSKAWP